MATPVTITIDEAGINADPPTVKIKKGARHEKITWTIATSGWKFTRDGIVIHGNFNQFTGRGSDHRREFHWNSRNSNTNRYEYTINVTNGTTTATRDPGIKNGGQ